MFLAGASYFDNTSLKEKEDDVVHPGGEHTYYWEVTSDVAPQKDDPACLTYTYVSHLNVVKDYNSGLIGTLLICKPGMSSPCAMTSQTQYGTIQNAHVWLCSSGRWWKILEMVKNCNNIPLIVYCNAIPVLLYFF